MNKDSKLRAWWAYRQGLDGRLRGTSPAAVLEQTGWARSVGGSSPYLTLFARCGASRQAVDEAMVRLELLELVAARGCTYVVPAAHFGLAVKVASASGPDPEMKVARKLGVTDKEIDRLCVEVLRALTQGPMDPAELRVAAGDASRSLGEEGKKKGLTTTLPLAVGRLQLQGEIRRIPVNGRLDQQRYRYALWESNPLRGFTESMEDAVSQLAHLYFRWIGPASVAQFMWFSGLGVGAAKAALKPLNVKSVAGAEELLILPELEEEFLAFRSADQPHYVLVSGLDSVFLLRRDLKSLLDEGDADSPVLIEKGAVRLADLPSHAIIDRGRIVGVWEYDQENQEIAWCSFVKANAELRAAVKRMEEFVREDLGDARSFSLDSPKSRKPRIDAIREIGVSG